jgi:hypothetical protein
MKESWLYALQKYAESKGLGSDNAVIIAEAVLNEDKVITLENTKAMFDELDSKIAKVWYGYECACGHKKHCNCEV